MSFGSWFTDRKVVDTELEHQIDIGSALNVSSPESLMVTHQKAARIGVPNKGNNIAVFDNLNVNKCFVEIDGVRHPKVSVSINYGEIDYHYHYRDVKLFHKEYVG